MNPHLLQQHLTDTESLPSKKHWKPEYYEKILAPQQNQQTIDLAYYKRELESYFKDFLNRSEGQVFIQS